MSGSTRVRTTIRRPGSLFIGGEWVDPSTDAQIDVVDAATEEVWLWRIPPSWRRRRSSGRWWPSSRLRTSRTRYASPFDSKYGLNASVFTHDTDRAYRVARRLRSGTVGHNAQRMDFGIAFGGFKQSGVGREGGREGLLAFLEPKTVILDGEPVEL